MFRVEMFRKTQLVRITVRCDACGAEGGASWGQNEDDHWARTEALSRSEAKGFVQTQAGRTLKLFCAQHSTGRMSGSEKEETR
jgi:hypothetical protein